MQKAKFQIKGMHCQSCAGLIEEKLKHQPGILGVKVSYDSQRAAIIFDETKTGENEIRQTIEGSGDYQLEKLEESENQESDRQRGLLPHLGHDRTQWTQALARSVSSHPRHLEDHARPVQVQPSIEPL